MTMTGTAVGQLPNMQRLVEQVELRQLHKHTDCDARQWLLRWLETPDPDLNDRRPSHFLRDPNCDLIILGLLITAQTRMAWAATHTDMMALY